MIRCFFTVIFCFLCVHTMMAQNQYYDALKLEKYLADNGQGKLVFNSNSPQIIQWTAILASYDPELSRNPMVQVNQVIARYINNPFLKGYLPEGVSLSVSPKTIFTGAALFSSIGGLDVTTFTEGLARFLVERAKEELNIAFFRRFKEELESPEYEDLRILFPETYRVLRVIDTEFYNYAPYIVALREAFKKDLSNLLDNLTFLFNSPRYATYFNTHPELRDIFNNALIIINGLANGEHPGDILNKIADTGFKAVDPNLHNGIKLLNMFSNSVKSTDPGRYWISTDSLKLLKNNTLIIFMGLIYQQVGDEIYFTGNPDTITFKQRIPDSLDDIRLELNKYHSFIREFIYKATIVDSYIRELKTKNPGDISYQDYHRYFSAAINLFEHISAIGQMLQLQFDLTAITNRVTNYLRLVGDIYQDINAQNYSSAIFNSTILLDSLLADNFKYRAQIIRYGSFMAAVVNAKDAAEVSAAIEAIALPSGSASIKRQTKTNIALNSYVGITSGAEYLDDLSQFKWVAAVYAPLGVAFSWGQYTLDNISGRYNECGAVTLFVSLIDIGAVTAYRFEDPESEPLPEIKFQNIFAPGINVVYGFANSPISFGLGGQLGPALRKISGASAEISSGVNYRIHAFLAVDIPIVNFYSNPR